MFCCTPSRKNPAPVVSRSRTTMKVTTLEHYWTVENFSKCHQREGTYIDSAPFYTDPRAKFFMRLYPQGDAAADKDEKDAGKYISMYLNFRSEDKNIESATVGCKFAIVSRYGVKSHSIEFKHKIGNGSGWGWRKFLKRSTIVDSWALTKNVLPGFVPNDELTIYCEVVYVTDIETDGKAVPSPTTSKPVLKKVTEEPKEKEEKDPKKLSGSQESIDTLQSYGSTEEAPEEKSLEASN